MTLGHRLGGPSTVLALQSAHLEQIREIAVETKRDPKPDGTHAMVADAQPLVSVFCQMKVVRTICSVSFCRTIWSPLKISALVKSTVSTVLSSRTLEPSNKGSEFVHGQLKAG